MLKCYYLFNYCHIIKFKAIYLEYRPVIFSFIFISDLNFKCKISIVFKLKQKREKKKQLVKRLPMEHIRLNQKVNLICLYDYNNKH